MTGKAKASLWLTLAAILSGVALAPGPLTAQERAISYADTFPIGSNGLCEAQIMEPLPGSGLFDRGYTITCRDAAAPVGTLWVVEPNSADDVASRFLPAASDCIASEEPLLPARLSAGAALACRDRERGTLRLLAHGTSKGRLYVAQALSAYRDVVRLGLATLVEDRLVAGEVEIPLTDLDNAQSFARAQAQAISANAALAEAYRRNNSGAFAEAAEFFAESASALSGTDADEASLGQALQQSNLGNYAEAERIFANVRGKAAGNPVLGRMLRNYEAIDALNAGEPESALRRLDEPLADGAATTSALQELEITEPMAERLSAEEPDAIEGTGSLTDLERADLLDGQALYLRAAALRLMADYEGAASALRASDQMLASVRGGRVTSILWLRAQVLGELGGLRERAGDPSGAEAFHRQAITLLEQNYPGSPALLSARAHLAGMFARTGRNTEALELYRALVADADDKPVPALRRLLVPYFDMLVGSPNLAGAAPADLFAAAQLLQRPGLAQTQAVLARELSGGSDEAAQLFRQVVNVARGIERMRNSIAQLEVQAVDNALLAERLGERRAELDGLQARQQALQERLANYPRYRAVTDDRLSLPQLQAALQDGEGYFRLITLEGASYGLFATQTAARAYAIDSTPDALEREVDAIRSSIAVVENGQTLTFPFDLARARALYVTLFQPIDADLRNIEHLVFEPDGAMLRLPANLLVMDDASVERYAARGGDEFDFTGTSWLGRAMRVSTAVSPAGFRDVRAAPASGGANEYIGFGENLPISETAGTLATRSVFGAGEKCQWAPSVWNYPIKADELRAAADSLQGSTGREEIVTGRAFTDTALLHRDDLDQFRILHFATHGLVTAPEPECPPRPALLTSFGDDQSDGLLSFAEIFGLEIDADLVILSACDTAGGATVGATREAGVAAGGGYALDGLVRAFVGAGGRSVIASHWPVPDDYDATNRLIGGFFRAPSGSTIGEAMRQSQEALMDEARTSHPFYWAAFAIVGDGASSLRR